MRSFSSLVMEAPGDCSPSRKVVSKMISLSAMVISVIGSLLGRVEVKKQKSPLRLQTGFWSGSRVRLHQPVSGQQ